MTGIPPSHLARWLPDWRELGELALTAAQDPHAEPVRLMVVADRASDWPSPFTHKRDQYVGAVLIWSAKAFCRQDSQAMRATLDGVLLEAALAFKGRLERAAAALQAPAPQAAAPIPFRRPYRADIDDKPDPDDGQDDDQGGEG